MLCSTHGRVHVCPIKALEAVSAEARAWLPERFRPHFLSGGAFKLGTEAQTSARLLAGRVLRALHVQRAVAGSAAQTRRVKNFVFRERLSKWSRSTDSCQASRPWA
jgi:hypothetical protein